MFAQFSAPANSISNPFVQVKLTAVFSHMLGTFRVPVVCTAVQPQILFPVYFAAPYTGSWQLHFEEEVAPGLSPFLTSEEDFSFTCVYSTSRGPWRPAIPEGTPYAVVEPQGNGTVAYRRPMTTTYLHLADPRWTGFPGYFAYPAWPTTPNPSYVSGGNHMVVNAIDDSVARGFNRIRIALNYSSQRSTPAAEVPANPPYWPTVDPAQPSQKPLVQYSAFPFQAPGATSVNTKFFTGTSSSGFTCQLDFERFDLNYWNHLDWILGLCQARGIQVSITLTLNSGDGADFEDQYLAPAHDTPAEPLPLTPDTRATPVATLPRVFEKKYQLYYWYVVGRLCSYPHVQYTIMHEYELRDGACSAPPSNVWGCSYPDEWVRWFGQAFAAMEPYLANNPSSKIMTVCPRRGSLYTSWWGRFTPRKVGFSHDTVTSGQGVFSSRISANLSAFRAAADRSWLSCIGLQRGGEIGLSTITGESEELYTVAGKWGTMSAVEGHRTTLDSGANYAPCPIFIEEDWIVGATTSTWRRPAPTYDSLDNPYCVRPSHFLTTTGVFPVPLAGTPNNPYAIPGLTNNLEGLEKWTRDYVWGAGIIAGAMVSYWGPRYSQLAEPYNMFEPNLALQPYYAASVFCSQVDWWNFSPDLEIVVSQTPAPGNRLFQGQIDPGDTVSSAIPTTSNWFLNNPPLPLGPGPNGATITRPAIEAQVVAARSGSGATMRLSVYSPVTGARGVGGNPPVLGPASFALDLTGLSGSITIQYVNPCTLSVGPVETTSIGSNPSAVVIPAPTGNPGLLGPHNEYVALVNFSIPGLQQ